VRTHKLSSLEVKNKSRPGRYGDGGGLYLQISKWGTKAWVFRYMLNGDARTMGLGSVETFSLKEARERARQCRKLLADGEDPIENRKAEHDNRRAEQAKRITFKDAATEFIKVHEPTWKNDKHRQQWRSTLETYAYGKLGDRPVSAIDDAIINDTVADIWMEKQETASRVKNRIQRIVKWIADGKPLPQQAKARRVKHHKALPYKDAPAFMGRLRGKDSISARALEFTVLCAVRTNEAILATWAEIDGDVWTIPADRMKSSREHRVPLSDRALEVLKNIPREHGSNYVFPGARQGRPLSNMAMLQLLRGMEVGGFTVHGFRSTFRDWAAEQTNYPGELAEAALAHVLKDKTEAAYQRGDLLDKRRHLMDAWTHYCASPAAEKGKVVSIRGVAS
jgi:integrase